MDKPNKPLIIIGIIFIIIALASVSFLQEIAGRIGILGIILLFLGVFIPNMKATGKKSAEKLNFREKDADDNCMTCKYSDLKMLNGSDAGCKWFEIKIDDNHVCDLFIVSELNPE